MQTLKEDKIGQHVVLPPHTFYALEDVLFFTDEQKKWLLSKRGTQPEEIGYFFFQRPRERPAYRALGMFKYQAGQGSFSEVSSDPRAIKTIKKFSSKHPLISIVPYHTHLIDELSLGDIQTMYSIYKGTNGQVHDFITICPSKIRVDRCWLEPVYRPGKVFHKNLIGTNFLKIVKRPDTLLDHYKGESTELEIEFRKMLLEI